MLSVSLTDHTDLSAASALRWSWVEINELTAKGFTQHQVYLDLRKDAGQETIQHAQQQLSRGPL